MPAPLRIEYIRQQVEQQSAEASPQAASLDALPKTTSNFEALAEGALDTTPPVLTALTVGAKVNASLAKAQLPITLKITDDLSGVRYIGIKHALHPDSGRT